MEDKMQKIVALSKRRGIIYPGSEIYGGLANSYDYGPLGAELLRNLRNLWWKFFIQNQQDMVGLDSSIISHHKVWEASGHVAGFADAMIDCKNCKARMRADHLIEGYFEKKGEKQAVEGLSPEELEKIIKDNQIKCPVCGKIEWTEVRKFNLLFPVQLGIVEGEQGQAYLRGETAQGIFINFKNVVDSSRVRLPFGIGQIGKSFRNEITPGNSIFRTIEFEQAEIEYFFDPNKSNWEEIFNEWKERIFEFVLKDLGIKEENLRWREHDDKERSFYSKRTEDLEYNFPFGFKELWGLAYRTDYDLTRHSEVSKQELTIMDPNSNEKILPHVIEPAVGLNRLLLMILLDSYTEDGERRILKLSPKLAPYKAAVFPLLANKPELVEKARGIYDSLKSEFNIAWDDRGNIGKRYLSQDEAGTPYCITVDFETLEDDAVTVRDRDTATQERVKISELQSFISSKLS
jgi:glycyl-tRNA synthetase